MILGPTSSVAINSTSPLLSLTFRFQPRYSTFSIRTGPSPAIALPSIVRITRKTSTQIVLDAKAWYVIGRSSILDSGMDVVPPGDQPAVRNRILTSCSRRYNNRRENRTKAGVELEAVIHGFSRASFGWAGRSTQGSDKLELSPIEHGPLHSELMPGGDL